MAENQETTGAAPVPDETGGGGGIDFGVVGGLVGGFIALLVGLLMEGGKPGDYVGPSAFIIVMGGTVAAGTTSMGIDLMKTMPGAFMRAVKYAPIPRLTTIRLLVGFAEKARREGLLVLEDDLREVDDEFLRKGVQLVVDGTGPELVKEILQTEVDTLAEDNHRVGNVWETLGGFAPTLGIIGTVLGLIVVLGNLSDPESLGPAISLAFIATLYGVCSANMFFLPIANKLKICSADEIAGRELMIEGILAIQSGDNPRIVEEKLVAFLGPKDKVAFLATREGDGRGDEFDLAA